MDHNDPTTFDFFDERLRLNSVNTPRFHHYHFTFRAPTCTT
jgi:hypothetical protein